MIIYALLFLLVISFFIHIASIIYYVVNKTKTAFNLFVSTLVSNMALSLAMIIFVLNKPDLIKNLDIKFILWVMSGIVLVIMLNIKISILRNVYKRSKDPANYHLNYFGKKVYGEGVIKKREFFTFLVTLPFFLLMGAYFVARLINLFIYGHI